MRYNISKTVLFFTALLLCLHSNISFAVGETSQVSVSSSGVRGNGKSDRYSSLSANGRYVAFTSEATNLVPEDTNAQGDVFVHDRVTKQTTRVSVDSNGIQGDDGSGLPSISADGRYIAFLSLSRNLVAPPVVGRSVPHIFVHNQVTKKTTMVGKQDPRIYSGPSISSDGRYVLFFQIAQI
ncbi:MAG: PD40 domain-containing protein [Methylococcaceae bacterium]|nr:PD40 domain-containing protein [Methylococcaceae bacterium]